MGMFDALKNNAVLKAFSKKLKKEEEEERVLHEEQVKQQREALSTLRCCANCMYKRVEESGFAISVFCGLYGHQIVLDDSVCHEFGWASGKEPKHEDNSMTLDLDSFGHATIKENKDGSQ